jgi:SAM-dependent methyltransferase
VNTTTRDPSDVALKAKHRAMWASGDYPRVARELVWDIGPELVRAAGVGPGQRVLDVAAGSGNAAIPAAVAGADVVASDLTPESFDAGRQAAAAAGVALTWEEGDAEALPYDDGSFDVVLSCLGVMFAPHHQAAADELVRVTRPGGTIGLASWTPEGFVGRMFGVMKPYSPPPPPGAQPPPLWGDETHVRRLLGDRATVVSATKHRVTVDRFPDGASCRDFFKAHYGPTIATYRFNAERPERIRELDEALAALGDVELAGGRSMGWEYLILTARRG